MEFTLVYTCLALVFISLILKHLSGRKYHLPPSPSPAIPVIGHLHLLKQPLHRTFNLFSQIHGPIFSLQLGVRRVVVISSPDLVEECFTAANDVVLSNRPRVLVDEYIGYDHTTMAGGPYGRQWHKLRRMGAQEVLSAARLNALSHIRQDEIRKTLQTLIPQNREWTKVKLRPILFEFVFNIITRMLAGKRYSGEEEENDEKIGDKFREMVGEVFEHAQSSNPEDFLPFLRWIDYRGLKRKLAALRKKMDDFYQCLLEEHRKEKRNTIIGHLLSLQESDPDFYTDQTIKGFMTNMIIAGTDTSVVTLEWAMSLLLNHPQVLEKAKLELDSQVGGRRFLEEQDLPNLHHLRNIISETFRMFPAGPLGVPRESSADCKVGGYDVPRGTILLVNAWAIHRDPRVWDEPTSFKPERFEGREVETQMLMPFGMGRRACPGSALGQRMVGLGLGSLIQCFDWKRVSLDEIDLAEGVGLTMPKLKPLEAMCRPRDIMLKVLQESRDNFIFRF
ncbi:cytochrome p450 81f1 [Phtheirospermum japonicum]|uniref:(+)-piperitol/(+)-sesamin synthase n=1 Tax=Phtheirospermum japonicum TaxID=374723 RepID=A0A830DL33_9LAMI|nr:cytochrome p450 81f1 [Phtheirospermum japonicum]